MTKISDTQAIILSRAAQNDERIALPLPASLRGGAASKVVNAMLAKGLLEEVDANTRRGEPIWRETGDGHGTTLVATDAGLLAIGIEPDATSAAAVAPAPASAPEVQPARKTREGTKQAAMIAMLSAEGGATLDEIAAATGWQRHTVRGALAGSLKKKLGLTIVSEKVEDRGRCYRIEPAT
jgi:hypothetical protein